MLGVGTMRIVPSSGPLLCLASAACFGTMAVFGKLAYDEGATVGTLLAVRFSLAAAVFWGVVLAGGAAAAVHSLSRRDAAVAVALGACGYAAQAGSYFAALEHIDASLLSLLIYTYPAIVAVGAVTLGRERAEGRHLVALGFASGGLVLVLAGAGAGALDPLGTALGLTAAVRYSAYVLVGEGIARRLRPDVLSALMCSGAAATLTAGSALVGALRPAELTPTGWGWLACLAVVSTVGAIGLFFAGLARVGPTRASILSTVEPLATVLLAFLVFRETMTAVQLLGAALVLSGLLVLHARPRRLRDLLVWRVSLGVPAPREGRTCMASNSKKKTTFAKMNRENAVRERRLRKQAKKDARKAAAAAPPEVQGEPHAADEATEPPARELEV
jgi:drug/metabolite transporter (DMT)-like permease